MREIKLRIERSTDAKRGHFDVWLWEDGEWNILTLTAEKLHNLTRNLVNEEQTKLEQDVDRFSVAART